MSKSFIFCFIFVLLQTSCFARDFIVEFVEENYKETQSSFSYSPVIYHSIQVRSEVGTKLLILTGDDYNHRKWLRQYIAENKAFIAKIPEDQTDLFLSSNAVEIDVINVHPFNLSLYRQEFDKKKAGKDRIELEKKQQQTELPKKVVPKKDQAREDEKKRLEKEKLSKALAQQQSAEDLKLKEALGKKNKNDDQLLAILAEQKAVEKQRRKEDLEQRWLELKQRLLEDERIKGLDQAERRKEIQKRWLELKQLFEQE